MIFTSTGGKAKVLLRVCALRIGLRFRASGLRSSARLEPIGLGGFGSLLGFRFRLWGFTDQGRGFRGQGMLGSGDSGLVRGFRAWGLSFCGRLSRS